MAQAQAAAALDRRFPIGFNMPTFVDAKDEAIARALAASLAPAIKANAASLKLLRRALSAWSRGDAIKAAKHALASTEADEANPQAYHVLAIALEKLGYLHKALVTYEKAFSLDPNDTDLLLNLGVTAWNAGHLDGAEKMFRLYIERCPNRPSGYNNLGSIQRERGAFTEAIETLRSAIYRMPTEPMLWNSLGTTLVEDSRVEEGLVFYQEALRLDENFSRAWHNLAYAYMHLGSLNEASACYDKTLSLSRLPSEIRESRHSRGMCLIGMGRLAEGFKEYEVRHDYEFRASVVHFTKAPVWKGESLAGKRIVLVGEQGLGDEIMFANILPDIQEMVGRDGKMQVAVDRRLISLFARSFPDAEIGHYEDRKSEAKHIRIFPWATKDGDPDFYAPMGTPLQYLRKSVGDFTKAAYLTPDSLRAAEFRARLLALGPGPYVGICWRSMVTKGARGKYYSAIDAWKPILTNPNVTFVNLQYGDCAAELAEAEAKFGIKIHNFADLDLKNDIDGGAALTNACDLVISAPTAAAALAGAIGKSVWFLLGASGWPQLGTDEYPWYASSRVFFPAKFGDWDEVIPRISHALTTFAAEQTTQG